MLSYNQRLIKFPDNKVYNTLCCENDKYCGFTFLPPEVKFESLSDDAKDAYKKEAYQHFLLNFKRT